MTNQQTVSLTGFAIIDNQGQLLLTPEELQDSVRVQLPADLPAAMAPTLRASDVVIVTPLSLLANPVGAVVYLQLNTAPEAYAIGRLSGQLNDAFVLTSDDPSADEQRVERSQINLAWAIRLLVNRRVC